MKYEQNKVSNLKIAYIGGGSRGWAWGLMSDLAVCDDISGDIYIYYKFAATDIFYGGITFRVRVEGGLKAGELRQIPAGHFKPGECRIVQVSIYE